MRKIRIRSVSWMAVALLAPMAGIGCSKGPEQAAGGGTGGAAPVTVATAIQRDIPVRIGVIGSVQPYKTVTIKSRVAGRIAEVHVNDGDHVTQGQLLFQIDPDPFNAALEQARANLQRDMAMAKDAEQLAKRQEQLYQQKLISPADYDKARYDAAAKAAVVKADQAAVDSAKLQLAYCTIRSPIDGRAGAVLTQIGNVVKNDDTSMLVINQIQPIYVTFSVPQQDLPKIRQYSKQESLPVQATIPPDSAHPVTGGKLTFINNQVDTATGTIMLKATFPNTAERLWPGLFVNVSLDLHTQPNAVLVPSQAVQPSQTGQTVFVVKKDMTVEVHPVETGLQVDHQTVILSGIAAGDRVVTDGQIRLLPGAKVEIVHAAATAPTTLPTAQTPAHATAAAATTKPASGVAAVESEAAR